MTDDKLAEIRERHERDDADVRNTWSRVSLRLQVHEDRAALLAEVERLSDLIYESIPKWQARDLLRERDEARDEVKRLRAALEGER